MLPGTSRGPDSSSPRQESPLHDMPQPGKAQPTSSLPERAPPTAISCAARNPALSVSSMLGKQADKMTLTTQQNSCRGTSHGPVPGNKQDTGAAINQLAASGTEFGQALASNRQEKPSALAKAADATQADRADSLAKSNAAAEALMREEDREKAAAQRKKESSRRRKQVKKEALLAKLANARAESDPKLVSGDNSQPFLQIRQQSHHASFEVCICRPLHCA